MRHTVVISDIHLWDAVPGDGLWMRYRQRRFFPDEALRAMLQRVTSSIRDGSLELVFNGDVFDFDVAPVENDGLRFGDPPRTEAHACERLDQILDDHPIFVGALAEVLSAGHRIVFVSGNHDAQLAFRSVQDRIVGRLVGATLALDPIFQLDASHVTDRIVFQPWFHRTASGIHVEHGNQYDRYCSFADPTRPFMRGGREIASTAGSLVVRHVVGRLGYFNPNHDASFDLDLRGFANHFRRYYMLTRHSLVVTWALGTARVAWRLLRDRSSHRAERRAPTFPDRAGVPVERVREHTKLFRTAGAPAIARTLGLDKAAIAVLALAAGAVMIANPHVGLAVAATAALAIVGFQMAVPNPQLAQEYVRVRESQRAIASIHGARAVVFGHTHEAYGSWEGDVFYGNCGTWSPRYQDVACTVPHEEGMPVIWLRERADGTLDGGLYRFSAGAFVPANERTSIAPSELPLHELQGEPRTERISMA